MLNIIPMSIELYSLELPIVNMEYCINNYRNIRRKELLKIKTCNELLKEKIAKKEYDAKLLIAFLELSVFSEQELKQREIATKIYLDYIVNYKKDLKKQPDNIKRDLLDLISSVIFYSANNDAFLFFKDIFNLIKSPSEEDVSKFYEYCLFMRDFKNAKKITKKFKKIKFEKLPDKIINFDAKISNNFNVTQKNKEVILKGSKLDLSKGSYIVSILDPNCGASLNAVEDILKDKDLINIFRKYGFVILGQHISIMLNEIIEWNNKYPDFKIHLVTHMDLWPNEIEWKRMPTFFFIKNGKLVSDKIIWCKKRDSKSKIIEATKKL